MKPLFTFIDLFAGIGGFRIGFQRAGGKCVFSSEWNKYARQTYKRWFGEEPFGDITKIKPEKIPSHDILIAGFPCQPFSIVGKRQGFAHKTQGTLFFNIIEIACIKRPAAIVLENVRNLKSHDQGKTWGIIKSSLEEIGYWVFDKILDAADWKVPQRRKRVFIVCFDKRRFKEWPAFQFPFPKPEVKPSCGFFPVSPKREKVLSILEEKVDSKYTLTNKEWVFLQNHADKQKQKGNGFGCTIVKLNSVSRTLTAHYFRDGSEILISQGIDENPRKLTPREAARLMGFNQEVARFLKLGDEMPIIVSDAQAYKQFGNAVVPAVSTVLAKQVVETLLSYKGAPRRPREE